MRQLKAGDVVALQSGSDHMTVESVSENGKVFCLWFVSGDVKYYEFAQETLKLIHSGDFN